MPSGGSNRRVPPARQSSGDDAALQGHAEPPGAFAAALATVVAALGPLASAPELEGGSREAADGAGAGAFSAAQRVARACRELGAAAAQLHLQPRRDESLQSPRTPALGRAGRTPFLLSGSPPPFLPTDVQADARVSESEDEDVTYVATEESGSDQSTASGHRAGLEGLALRSVAPSTLKAYKQAWGEWEEFARGRKQRGKSGHRMMLSFIWQLYVSGRSRAVVSRYLAGIAFFCRIKGVPDLTKSGILLKAMKGWARVAPTPPDRRRPIDAALLPGIIGSVGAIASSMFESLLFRLAFSMAYHGAFRISELVAPSKQTDSRMLVEDVVVSGRSLLCRLRRSKTDQVGKGRWVTLVPALEESICPVRLAVQYEAVRPDCRGSWLLHYDGLPVTKFQFRWMMGRCLTSMGLSPSHFGTHSFRIGAATAAAAAGFSGAQIQAVGRWKSSCYKRYIRPVA
ncbi:uncharacterized protein LOC134927301 [Pseudophryne corroboree]|uniref:uncharacterized protein LOC134927301 n=1 Tax=Pseudophryne corroboree TaxID=495146 RepID=UPI0030819F50